MQIFIKDHGPLKEKVTVTIDGEVIVFPISSFVKLEGLLVTLGAKLNETLTRGESYWVFNRDEVRENAHRVELGHATQANAQLSAELEEAQFALRQRTEKLQGEADWWQDDYNRVNNLSFRLVEELQKLQSAPLWGRLWWVFRGRRLC